MQWEGAGRKENEYDSSGGGPRTLPREPWTLLRGLLPAASYPLTSFLPPHDVISYDFIPPLVTSFPVTSFPPRNVIPSPVTLSPADFLPPLGIPELKPVYYTY